MIRRLFHMPYDGDYTNALLFLIWVAIAILIICFFILVTEITWNTMKYRILKEIKEHFRLIKLWTEQGKNERVEAKEVLVKTVQKVDEAKEEIKETVKQVKDS
jgi:F0F1-type ATP synthase membrane subunit b/b'